MTRIKFCGLSRPLDIEAANELKVDYIGFVFAKKSKRYVTPEVAKDLRKMLDSEILATGVFVNEKIDVVASLLKDGIIDIAQLHGNESEEYIKELKMLSGKPIIKAFKVEPSTDMANINLCSADYVMLDAGYGEGKVFDWDLIKNITRPYFLAGGLSSENVKDALKKLHPFALDVSSGIESDGLKDKNKMAAFADMVRKEDNYDK